MLSIPQDNPRPHLQCTQTVHGDEPETVWRLHAAIQGRETEVSGSESLVISPTFVVIRYRSYGPGCVGYVSLYGVGFVPCAFSFRYVVVFLFCGVQLNYLYFYLVCYLVIFYIMKLIHEVETCSKHVRHCYFSFLHKQNTFGAQLIRVSFSLSRISNTALISQSRVTSQEDFPRTEEFV